MVVLDFFSSAAVPWNLSFTHSCQVNAVKYEACYLLGLQEKKSFRLENENKTG